MNTFQQYIEQQGTQQVPQQQVPQQQVPQQSQVAQQDQGEQIAAEMDRFGMALKQLGVPVEAIRDEMQDLIAQIEQTLIQQQQQQKQAPRHRIQQVSHPPDSARMYPPKS